MSDESYNGWRNYETWAVNLWLGEAGDYASDLARECVDDADGDADDAERDFAQRLESLHDEESPADVTGIYADLLSSAFGRVDWREIASHYIPDAVEDWKRDNAEESAQEEVQS